MSRTQLLRTELAPRSDIDAVATLDTKKTLGRAHYCTNTLVHWIDHMDARHKRRIRSWHPANGIAALSVVQPLVKASVVVGSSFVRIQVWCADGTCWRRRCVCVCSGWQRPRFRRTCGECFSGARRRCDQTMCRRCWLRRCWLGRAKKMQLECLRVVVADRCRVAIEDGWPKQQHQQDKMATDYHHQNGDSTARFAKIYRFSKLFSHGRPSFGTGMGWTVQPLAKFQSSVSLVPLCRASEEPADSGMSRISARPSPNAATKCLYQGLEQPSMTARQRPCNFSCALSCGSAGLCSRCANSGSLAKGFSQRDRL